MKTIHRFAGIILFFYSLLLVASPITSPNDPGLTRGQLIDFNNLTLGNYPTINTGGVTFSNLATITVPPIQGYSIINSASLGLTSNGLRYSTSTFPLEPPQDFKYEIALKFDFNRNISAFGFDLAWANYPLNLSLYDSSKNLLENYDLPDNQFRNFYAGLKGNNNIRYALLTGIGNDEIILDNLKTVVQTPISASLWLFGSAFFALAGVQLRKKS